MEGLPIAVKDNDKAVTPSGFTDAHRFALLVRMGSPIENIAVRFGISIDEAKKRARALEMSR